MHNIKPIGTIKTPFKSIEDMPIQPKGAKDVEGIIILDEELSAGLKDLDGFSHIYLIYSFHEVKREELIVTPFMDTQKRGVFSTRSPLRPNHIGLSIVKLKSVQDNKVYVDGIDVLDGTPLLDIKPFIEKFDGVKDSKSGWLKASAEDVINKRSDKRFE
ncbi:tRNA (N6-threonylcarbamoyladenosine(37)-N6)-methyltransferase TrmO [Arcobacter arenosus]|uniref:tRNA (N6-threonylcarbamoyladenosine(37)-N6)-methyltransferase TrmO n=1 Tax=Arcobacter arenosus TaxID=2576037 RepID=A0A5R8Y0J6_9BACT|nr:tRNA (N6-threonylcarbamoyladenosine(37)-N6)-methyltransferase TrmO [Arcobacter arenosus]TLP37593.1 tRNA (N6-threonylcarbamoyladenosine(37)-N6)-methyltransferase TrmO [Arcobacter arenosus]